MPTRDGDTEDTFMIEGVRANRPGFMLFILIVLLRSLLLSIQFDYRVHNIIIIYCFFTGLS